MNGKIFVHRFFSLSLSLFRGNRQMEMVFEMIKRIFKMNSMNWMWKTLCTDIDSPLRGGASNVKKMYLFFKRKYVD